jgi:uncharacterized protein
MWSGWDVWRTEVTWVDLAPDRLMASGTQLGIDPVPHRLDYRLDTARGFVTKRLEVEAAGEGWTRRLDLTRDEAGTWRLVTDSTGRSDLADPGGDAGALAGALDCDLGLSPLTNTMPVRRHGLHRQPGANDFLMAWVSVPDLGVHAARQRYEHLRINGDRAMVRYRNVGTPDGFTADLEMDDHGLVILYPGLARRVEVMPK